MLKRFNRKKQKIDLIIEQNIIVVLKEIDGRKNMALTLMYITNNPDVANIAQKCGVDRIWIDLETLGKEERQGHIDSVKSHHTIEDIRAIRPIIKNSELLVRINPINPNSKLEIDEVVEAGADIIMLPMWKSIEDVRLFVRYVNGRAKTMLLLETREAAECIDDVLQTGGFDEIHIGLNDLHLSYGLDFMFELLANGTVEKLCRKIEKYGIPYGFGGIARLDKGLLPSENVIMEHYRLNSTRAILSRSFCDANSNPDCEELFEFEMKRLRDYERSMDRATEEDFEYNRKKVIEIVNGIVKNKK